MEISLRNKHCLQVILLFLACFAAYSGSLSHDFVFEDKDLIVNNPYVKSARYLDKIFKTDMYDLAYEGAKPNYYRPLETLSFMADYRLFRLNAFGFHLTNLIMHFINSVLAYCLLYLLFKNLFIASASSILFCVHPINIAAVAFITGRSDLLAALFMLSAFLCALLLMRSGRRRKTCLTLIALFSFLALLSRENAVFMPLGILLLFLFSEGQRRDKVLCLLSAGCMVAAVLYFRSGFLHIPLTRHDFLPLPLALKLMNFLHVAASYLSLLIMPAHLYLMHVTEPILSVSDARLWLSLGLALFVLIVLYMRRKDAFLFFGAAWFLVFISQALFLMSGFYGGKIGMFEHWAYLASIGFYVIVSRVFYRCKKYLGVAFYPLLAAFVLICIGLTMINSAYYKDSLTLSGRILRFNPDNKEARKELAGVYLRQRQYELAESNIKEALRLAPDDPDLYLMLGAYYEDTEDIEDAVAAYEKLLEIEPSSARACNNLGAIYFNKEDLNQARSFFERSVKLNPLLFEPYLNMAKLSTKNNNTESAVSFYKKAIQLNPDATEAVINLTNLYLEGGDFAGALSVLNDALAKGERDASVLLLSGIAHQGAGFSDKAGYYFNEALKTDPKSEEVALNVGVFYASHNRLDEAIKVWQEGLKSNPGSQAIKGNIARAQDLLRTRGKNMPL